MTRALVVFYSLTGHTRTIAAEISRLGGFEMAEVIETRKRSTVLGRLRAVIEVLLGLKPEVSYHGPEPTAFDIVIVGSPVWASHMASPINRFLSEHRIDSPKVGCFFCYGGQGVEKATEEFARVAGKLPDATLTIRDTDIGSSRLAERIRSFVGSLSGETLIVT